MVRKFVTYDGEVIGEHEWKPTLLHSCFYCGVPLIFVQNEPCPDGLLNEHDFVTLCESTDY